MPTAQNKFTRVNHNTLAWKIYLGYDILMMVVIIVNLVCILANTILMSHFAQWFSELIQQTSLLTFYKTDLHPWVKCTETWFICFLVIEFLLRWLYAVIQKHHQRWFFFPFIHWYEILAIFPALRFLRLLRVGIIAYRLHELGYKVVPTQWQKSGRFYYNVLMEEISDRVVLTVIDGVKHELDTSETHKKIIHDLVDHHRILFAQTLTALLQETLATEFKKQQIHMAEGMGDVIERAISETPEFTQVLRLIPIVGSRIEDQIQHIGKRLGKNVAYHLLEPLTVQPNPTYQLIAKKLSELNIDNQHLEKLVESMVYESLESIRKQVKIKQWQQLLTTSKSKEN